MKQRVASLNIEHVTIQAFATLTRLMAENESLRNENQILQIKMLEPILQESKKGTQWNCWLITKEGKAIWLVSWLTINCFGKDRTNLIHTNKSILQLFRHNKCKPENFHLWRNTERIFCHRISNHGIGWSNMKWQKRHPCLGV